MTKSNYGISDRLRAGVTEQLDPGAGPQEPASHESDLDPAAASARKTRELSALLSQAWSGRS
jgi:hypothetical protein